MRRSSTIVAAACSGALAACCVSARSAAGPVLPPPQRCLAGAARVSLPAEVTIAIGEKATPRERYAADALVGDLRTRFGKSGHVVAAGAAGAEAASIFLGRREGEPLLWRLARKAAGKALPVPAAGATPEGYTVELAGSGKHPVVAIVGSGTSGALYGAFTLVQLFERRGDAVVLPSPLEVVDAPALETRAYTGAPRDVSPASLATLDWLARWRLNAGYYEIYGDQGQDEVPAVVADLARECDRRGILLYGCVSNWRTERYLKRQLCASNPEDVRLVERLFTQLADRGCRALVFLFDDLTQESVCHTETCDACKRTYGELAGTQTFWVRKMVEVGKRKGVSRFLFCPTPYYRGWEKSYSGKLDGVAYYRRLAEAADLASVEMYHCPFSAKEMAAVQKAGLRNFVWWQNGVYSLPALSESLQALGIWGGVPEVAWGWYGSQMKPGAGPVTSPEVLKDLQTFAQRAEHAWLCSGGDLGFAIWGTYAWNPAKYDPAATEKALVDALLGQGASGPYTQIEASARQWAYRFADGIQAAGADGDPGKVLSDLGSAAAQARSDLARLKELAAGPQARPGLLSGEKAQGFTGSLAADIGVLERKLEQGRSGRASASVPPLGKDAEGGGSRFENKMTLAGFIASYTLRYAIHEEPAGSFRRCQWHFGSGLGMTAPSCRNWYDAGFIDVEVNGKSLDACRATFTAAAVTAPTAAPGASDAPSGSDASPRVRSTHPPAGEDERGGDRIVGRWEGEPAAVTLTFGLSRLGALLVSGQVEPRHEIQSLRVLLWCIPSAGSGDWKDMDRWLASATRTLQHSRGVQLDPGKEDWVVYYDKTYDVPHEKAEGPCALMFVPSQVAAAEVDLADYVVGTTLTYPKECRRFGLALWDLHGARNQDAIRRFREGAAAFREELAR